MMTKGLSYRVSKGILLAVRLAVDVLITDTIHLTIVKVIRSLISMTLSHNVLLTH